MSSGPSSIAANQSDETKRPFLLPIPSLQNGLDKNVNEIEPKGKAKRNRKRKNRNRNKNKQIDVEVKQEPVVVNIDESRVNNNAAGQEILKLINGRLITSEMNSINNCSTEESKTNPISSQEKVANNSSYPIAASFKTVKTVDNAATSVLSSSVKVTNSVPHPITFPDESSSKSLSQSLPSTTNKLITDNKNRDAPANDTTKKIPNTSTNKSMELELGLKQATDRINRDYIFELKKPSKNFPRAKYLCELCNYHLDTIPLCHKHIKEKRHRKLFKEKQQDDLLSKLPKPSKEALNALQRLLVENVLKSNVMDDGDTQICSSVVKKLSHLVTTSMPGCTIHLYGSSLSGFGFKDSDINVDIRFPTDIKAPTVLLQVLDVLKKSDLFSNVSADFRAKVPMISFVEASSTLKSPKLICLSAGNDFALLTSKLLLFYSKLDPRVKQLSMVMRKFARMCKLDRQHEGSLPSHSFVIMTIFFMQRYKYLPVLHEFILEHDMYTILNKSMDCSQITTEGGDIWYHPSPPPASAPEVKENKDSTDLDETQEFSDSESETEGNVVFEPVNTNNDTVKKGHDPVEPINLSILCNESETSLAKMWTEILKFYAVDYHMEDLVISIVHSNQLTRADKEWGRKRIAMIDPYASKRNMCRSLNSQSVFSYMLSRLKALLIYFHSTPAKNNDRKVGNNSKTPHNKNNAVNDKSFANGIIEDLISGVVKMGRDSLLDSQIQQHENDKINNAIGKCLVETKNQVDNSAPAQLEENDIVYEFSKEVITNGNLPVIVCGLCKQEGHLRSKCPDEIQKIHLQDLPPFSKDLAHSISSVCCEIYEMYKPSANEVKDRNGIYTSIMNYLQDKYNSKTRMKLFGSSRNGFGFRGSDLDICMTYSGDDTGEDLDFVHIIENVSKCLKQNRDLYDILAITTAKVPIVKFKHRQSGLEGDISLYNVLAQQNTSMLLTYSAIDERCKILGYSMKAFVKLCSIGDASRGSLSSYAYTLMAIFYLQQRDPPVLPVLQEMYSSDRKPEKIIDGWNTWFLDDMDQLGRMWACTNKESIGELWHGMLRFYTEDFDFSTHVITIRQKQPLTTFEKEWTSKFISIEDPFDLSHNLGAGVSRKMTNFILKVFIKARQHFGIFPHSIMHNEMQHFFDPYILMSGEEAPNDRCCRICGKIGHFVRDCPKNKRRRRNDEDQESGMSEIRCFSCGKRGHMKKNCPEMKNNQSNTVSHNHKFNSHQANASPQSNNLVRPNIQPRRNMHDRQDNEQYNSPNRNFGRKNSNGNIQYPNDQPKAQRKLKGKFDGMEAPSPRSGTNMSRSNGMFQHNSNLHRTPNSYKQPVDRNAGVHSYNKRGPTVSSPLRIPFNDPQRHHFEQQRYHDQTYRGSTSPMNLVMPSFFGTPPPRLPHTPRSNYPRAPMPASPRSPHFGEHPSPGQYFPPTPEHQFPMSPMKGFSPRFPNGNPS